MKPLTKILATETRKQYIACAQLIALHINPEVLASKEAFIALNNGTESSGKSLTTMAFGAQLIPLKTSDASFIGQATWESAKTDFPLRIHFRDAADKNAAPPSLDEIDLDAFKKGLNDIGNIVFLQNYPDQFKDIADISFHTKTIGNPEEWKRSQRISIFSNRLMADEGFINFFVNLDQAQINAAAALIPDNYLMPDGGVYERVIG